MIYPPMPLICPSPMPLTCGMKEDIIDHRNNRGYQYKLKPQPQLQRVLYRVLNKSAMLLFCLLSFSFSG